MKVLFCVEESCVVSDILRPSSDSARHYLPVCKYVYCVSSVYLNGIIFSAVIVVFFLLSFFLAGRVFSPALRPYMIGPMRSPDIQNLLEAFASIKREKSLRGLCKPQERSPME